jgi:hypothetical protein
MTQNTSSAVMQQRKEARDSLDDFPTPPWATRALLRHVLRPLGWRAGLQTYTACDPCCNRGHMVRPLHERFGQVHAVDVADYTGDPRRAIIEARQEAGSGGAATGIESAQEAGSGGAATGKQQVRFQQDGVGDFLMAGWETAFARAAAADFFVMNPPFRLALPFIHRALRLARVGVAVFIRSAFPEGQERYRELFSCHPPTAVAYFAERVVLHRGVLRDPDIDYWDRSLNVGKGGWRSPSTATGSIWMAWLKQEAGSAARATGTQQDAGGGAAGTEQPTRALWIPPCRKALTRPGDYPANPDQKGVFVPPSAAGQGGLAL